MISNWLVTVLSHRCNSLTDSGEAKVFSHVSSETRPCQAALLLDTLLAYPGSQPHQCVRRKRRPTGDHVNVHAPIVAYCWLQMIYNWANNSLTSKGYEQIVHMWLHAALVLISKQAHLLTTAHAVNTVQFKVSGTDPYMAMVYLHIGQLQLWLLMPHRSVKYGLSSAC